MRANDWNVSYEIVTEESAKNADVAERGMLSTDTPLRIAVEECGEIGANCIEADRYPLEGLRSITFSDDQPYGGTSRSLHIPDRVTSVSRMRLARLLGVYGAKRR